MALRSKVQSSEFRVQNSPRLITSLLLAFFGWSCLAALTTVYRHDTLLELTRIGGCVVWFLIARALLKAENSAPRLRFWLLSAIVAGAIWVCVPALLDFAKTKNPRQFSTFYNPNLLAGYCAMALPLALAWAMLALREATARRLTVPSGMLGLIACAPAGVILLGLIVTSSKGGLLAMLAGMVVFVLAVSRAKGSELRATLRAHRAPVAIVALVMLIGGGAVMSKTVLPRIMQARTSDDNSTMFRYYTWRGTVNMAQARPVLGWGPGSFPSAYPKFAITSYTRTAHQVWLQTAAENGFPALLLLLGTCLAVGVQGWRALHGGDWPVAAGGLAALVAFMLHGLLDGGWSITSITLLLLIVLALLDDCGSRIADRGLPEEKQQEESKSHAAATRESAIRNPQSAIQWPWLVATLVVAGAAAGTQRAVNAEDAWFESDHAVWNGAPAQALQRAHAAVGADPLSARMWSHLGRVKDWVQQDGHAELQRALHLEPARPSHALNLAEAWAQRGDAATAARFFDQAVELAPRDSHVRLARARWRLARNDARGWQDLEYVVALAEQPYGKYQPIEEMVNLDFARAALRLAERALKRGDKEAARRLLARAAPDVARARAKEARQRELMKEAERGTVNLGPAQDLSALEAQLQDLKEQAR